MRRYEIRNFRLYVEGEPQAVSFHTVKTVVELHARRTAASEPWDSGTGPIPEMIGRLIVSLESWFAVRALARAIQTEIPA